MNLHTFKTLLFIQFGLGLHGTGENGLSTALLLLLKSEDIFYGIRSKSVGFVLPTLLIAAMNHAACSDPIY